MLDFKSSRIRIRKFGISLFIFLYEIRKTFEDLIKFKNNDPSLTYIIWGGLSSIDNEGARAIAETLKTNQSLTSLYLGANEIGAEGAKAIAEALRVNRDLIELSLYRNQSGNEGARAIAETLKTNQSLTKLNLEGNGIDSEGARAIAEALKTNQSLTTLDLSYSGIGSEGAKAIAEALKTNQSLISLDIKARSLSTKIGSEGAKAIAEALKTNQSLTTLDLWGANIGHKGVKAIAEALKTNQSLTYLSLEDNNIGDELKTKIDSLTERNCKIRNDFVTLSKEAITQKDKTLVLLEKMKKVPVVHQIYALIEIIKEAGKLGEEEKDINNHLKMIKFFLDNKVLVKGDILEAARETKNSKIEELIKSKSKTHSSDQTQPRKSPPQPIYQIPYKDQEDYNTKLKLITDNQGKLLKNNPKPDKDNSGTIIVEIKSEILKKDLRNKLGLFRIKINDITNQQLEELKDNFPTSTIEIETKQNQPESPRSILITANIILESEIKSLVESWSKKSDQPDPKPFSPKLSEQQRQQM